MIFNQYTLLAYYLFIPRYRYIDMIDTIVSKQYRVVEKLGISPFFQVYKGVHVKNETFVAMKIERKSVSESKVYQEVRIIKELQGQDQFTNYGLPKVVEVGSQGNYHYAIMELLGISVADQFSLLNRIPFKQSIKIGIKMLERIQFLHSKGYVHRDLRLQNFIYGFGKNSHKIYISGLTTCKKYLRVDNRHVMYRDNKLNFTGTAKFVSVNTQLGIEQSRRDDIEAFLYIVIYMIKGNLPWLQHKSGNHKEKYDKILYSKMMTPIQTICEYLPAQFVELLSECRKMEYEEVPNYNLIKEKLKASSKQENDKEMEGL